MAHHDHHHHASSSSVRLAATSLWSPHVHRLGRRRFLAELGRGAFAMAIVGAGVSAGSGDDDDPAGPGPTLDPGTDEEPITDAASEPTPEPADGEAEPEAPAEALEWSQVSLGSVSAYVLVRGREAAVVDTGTEGSADEIGSALSTLGADWSEVAHVVLTHSHPDHVGSLSEVLGEAPTATAYAGEADIGNIAAPNPLQSVGNGDDVLGLEIIETPGHTPGSISMLDRGIGLLIAGDALNGNEAGSAVLGPDPRFSSDMDSAVESVRRLTDFDFETAVFGHGNPVLEGADDMVDLLARVL